MKIIQIATSTDGGAGIAARRLNSTLNGYGEDSTLFSGSSPKLTIEENENIKKKNFIIRNYSRLLTFFQRFLLQRNVYLMTPWSIQATSSAWILDAKPDVIHIHTFYNLLSTETISDLCESGKPIFITLHDERFYTGGCHHALGCANFKSECAHCPQSRALFDPLVIRQQRKLSESFKKAKSLTVIAPSDWIAARARRSTVLEFAEVVKINNPLESEFISNSILEKKGKKSSSSFVVSFVAQDLFNPYKGLKTLLKCIEIHKNEFIKEQILFMFVGRGPEIDIKELKFKQIDKLFTSQMTDIYFETDLLIVPSLVDNSPNVIFEALACGTPFVGSDQAGIPEISAIFGMESFVYGDPHSMLRAIIKQKESQLDPVWVRNTALELVHPDKVAARVLELYRSKLTDEV